MQGIVISFIILFKLDTLPQFQSSKSHQAITLFLNGAFVVLPHCIYHNGKLLGFHFSGLWLKGCNNSWGAYSKGDFNSSHVTQLQVSTTTDFTTIGFCKSNTHLREQFVLLQLFNIHSWWDGVFLFRLKLQDHDNPTRTQQPC